MGKLKDKVGVVTGASGSQTPLGRIGQPRDIAPTVVFLASEDAGWMTGETLLIAGGLR